MQNFTKQPQHHAQRAATRPRGVDLARTQHAAARARLLRRLRRPTGAPQVAARIS